MIECKNVMNMNRGQEMFPLFPSLDSPQRKWQSKSVVQPTSLPWKIPLLLLGSLFASLHRLFYYCILHVYKGSGDRLHCMGGYEYNSPPDILCIFIPSNPNTSSLLSASSPPRTLPPGSHVGQGCLAPVLLPLWHPCSSPLFGSNVSLNVLFLCRSVTQLSPGSSMMGVLRTSRRKHVGESTICRTRSRWMHDVSNAGRNYAKTSSMCGATESCGYLSVRPRTSVYILQIVPWSHPWSWL